MMCFVDIWSKKLVVREICMNQEVSQKVFRIPLPE